MPVIEGDKLKPCKELHTKTDKNGQCINLMTHCDHPRFALGCLDGRGDCKDYSLAEDISEDIKNIANQIEERKE